MNNRLLVSLVAAACLVAGTIWGTTGGAGASSGSENVETVERGEVAVTVGGIGHVTTLTEAARLAVPPGSGTAASPAVAAGPADLVFATVAGHVTTLLVEVGEEVRAGEPVAELEDGGTAQQVLLQARSDLSTARLELAQKLDHDPTLGPPPTAAELEHARLAMAAAQDNLNRIAGSPLPSDVAAAQLELNRAIAELDAEQAAAQGRPHAVDAAQEAVAAAGARLAALTGAPDPAELTAARLELARAQLEQETLLRQPAAPSAAQVAAADAAIAAAQEKVIAALTPADLALAQSELARARADREALTVAAPPPSAAALAAAQLAVDTAQRKLDQLQRPPAAAVSAARGELARAKADLVAAQRSAGAARIAAAEAAVTAAQAQLGVILQPPPEAVSTARAEVGRASADLAILRQRGAPASATDLAIARLRVRVGEQQVRLAQEMVRRSVVRAPATGTVTSVLTAEGSAVDATSPMLRVQDLDNLVVSVNLTEFDVNRTRVGALARVTADALDGETYAGEVSDVGISGANNGGIVTFPLIVSVDDSEGLRPGMSVSVRVVVQRHADVVRLPLDAIEERDGREATISVLSESGDVEQRTVTLGLVGAQYAEVREGLRAGEKVVIPTDEEA